MKLIKEIFHKENLNLKKKIITRKAVRGVIIKNNEILMIYSQKNGDYKFPGGGIKKNETPKESLKRELKEECGAILTEIYSKIGKVIEYDLAVEDNYDIFKMISYYYLCKIEPKMFNLNLDKYEKELGFKPIWLNIYNAIQQNNNILDSNIKNIPRWVKRDTYMLKYIYAGFDKYIK